MRSGVPCSYTTSEMALKFIGTVSIIIHSSKKGISWSNSEVIFTFLGSSTHEEGGTKSILDKKS